MTAIVSKQLQPVYDKPMIFYPLSLLMLCGIKEYLIISTERDTPFIKMLLGDGAKFGIDIQYAVQKEPRGLPEAFIIGEEFIGDEDVTLILGDNIFYGDLIFFEHAVRAQKEQQDTYRGRVFGYYVDDPRNYGVAEFEKATGKILSIEEKPKEPKSNYAIPGLYIFDKTVGARARALQPSPRGEIEIVDLMKSYLNEEQLKIELIGPGVTWFDTGTALSLLDAGQMIAAIEKRSGIKIACLEEIALRLKFLTPDQFQEKLEVLPNSPYRQYLHRVYLEVTGEA